MGTSEATQAGQSGSQETANQSNQSASSQDAASAHAQQGGTAAAGAETTTDRPRFEWTPEQQAEISRIAANEARTASAKALRDKQKEIDDAAALERGEHTRLLSEARSENQRLLSENGRLKAQSAVRTAATKLKANEPDAIFHLIKDELEFDADNNATNVDELLGRKKQQYPGLFGSANPPGRAGDGGQRGTPNGKTDMNSQMRAALGYGSQ